MQSFVARATLAFGFLASCLTAQEGPLRSRVAELYSKQDNVRSFSQTGISPDGALVAWSVDGGAQNRSQRIYIADAQSLSDAHPIHSGTMPNGCSEHDPVWANNSRELAFLSDCASPGQDQIFVQNVGGDPAAAPKQLTHLNGYLSHLQWSAAGDDGIAFLFVDHASRRPSPMAAENKAVGVIDDLRNTEVQVLAVTDVQSGVARKVTRDDLYVFEFDRSKDGKQFVFTAAPPPGDDNWYVARLYTLAASANGGAHPQQIYKPDWQIALPRWSPDGHSIAFIEGLMSDEGGTGGDLFVLPAKGGKPRNLTSGQRSTPAWFTWLSDGQLLFTEFTGGSTAIGTLEIANGASKTLWQGDETLRAGPEETSLSISHAGEHVTTALIRMSWSMLPEVCVGPIGQWNQATALNSRIEYTLPRFENVTWQSDQFRVQGWLLYPSNYDAARRYPLLVAVHGGPAWIARPEWRAADFDTTLFTNFGYFVFFPNVRGSYGQGEEFTRANRRDWGFGDLRDLLAGVDAVLRDHPVDPARVGLLGWSYGGSTAMMGITQTHRFRAAVAGAGAGNWQSYYGQNSIDKWMIPYFGASAYDDPAAYVHCSAITYIKNAKTPILVLVGERDGEAPPAQSVEFWHALKELGVPTRLVIYEGEGHSFVKQEDRIDISVRTLEWFGQYMPASSSERRP